MIPRPRPVHLGPGLFFPSISHTELRQLWFTILRPTSNNLVDHFSLTFLSPTT